MTFFQIIAGAPIEKVIEDYKNHLIQSNCFVGTLNYGGIAFNVYPDSRTEDLVEIHSLRTIYDTVNFQNSQA